MKNKKVKTLSIMKASHFPLTVDEKKKELVALSDKRVIGIVKRLESENKKGKTKDGFSVKHTFGRRHKNVLVKAVLKHLKENTVYDLTNGSNFRHFLKIVGEVFLKTKEIEQITNLKSENGKLQIDRYAQFKFVK